MTTTSVMTQTVTEVDRGVEREVETSTQTSSQPLPPVPPPRPPPPPPPPPYSLTEIGFDQPKRIADLTCCSCGKGLIHVTKMVEESKSIEVAFPPESNAKHPCITLIDKTKDWKHSISLVPCWHYHFFSNGSIKLMNKCPNRTHKEHFAFCTVSLTRAEKCLESNSSLKLIQCLDELSVPPTEWGREVQKRFGSIETDEIVELSRTLGLSHQARVSLIEDCVRLNVLHKKTNVILMQDVIQLLLLVSDSLKSETEKMKLRIQCESWIETLKIQKRIKNQDETHLVDSFWKSHHLSDS
jgi:hypothetical protein